MATEAQLLGEQIEAILVDLRNEIHHDHAGERLLSRKQACTLLSVSMGYLSKLVELGEINQYDISRDGRRPLWRLRHSELQSFIDRVAS